MGDVVHLRAPAFRGRSLVARAFMKFNTLPGEAGDECTDGLETRTMTDETARRQLRSMLKHFTQGSILHLLSEVFEEMSEQARHEGAETRAEQCRTVAATLFAVGLGIDAACPR